MRAWFITPDHEWGDFFHGKTRGKAKAAFWKHWHMEAGDWTALRTQRIPELDDKPITPQTLKDCGIVNDWKYCLCGCEVCKTKSNP